MPNIKGSLVQIGELDSDKMLKTKFSGVHIRLLKENPTYAAIINEIVDYMEEVLDTKFKDYATLKGISGANVGIPINIIIVVTDDGNIVMLNPEIQRKSSAKREVTSNCGSLRLENPIKVSRHKWITVSYFDLEGESTTEKFEGAVAATIQHEIDHNMGILITDRQKEE